MEWKEVTLGDLCEISSSKRIFAKEYQSDGVPFYRGKEIIAKQKGNAISNELFISRNRYEEIKARYGVPQQRELLLTSVGTLGVPYVIKEEEFYFKDGNLTWFRHFNGLDVEYLYYWFLSPYGKNEINTKAIGSTQKALTIDSLSKFDIKIPANLDDQRRIASILSSLDRKIELNNKINADLEEMAQAIFKNWFIDFEPFKDGKFVDSELGMIPEGWKVGCLGDIAEITSGKRPPKKSKDKTKELFIPLIGASDIMGFTSDVLYERPILVIGRVGTHGVVQRFQEKCWPSDNTLVIESSYYNYVYQLLKGIDYSAINRGSTQPLITQTDVKNTDVIIAPENVLKEYESITSTLFSKHRANIKENSRLSTLRDTLLPRLMSGELEVPE